MRGMTATEQPPRFVDQDLAGAQFREVNLIGARMRGVLLMGADIDGAIDGLRVNGVEVAPLIEAELNRLHPERTKLRPATPAQALAAVDVVDTLWAASIARVREMPRGTADRSVDNEWSFTETLRHLIFVTDAWFGHAVLAEPRPFHPFGLPASFIAGGADIGIDESAKPSLDDLVAVRDEKLARLREFLAAATQDDLDRVREPNPAPGFPPPAARSAVSCLRVLFNEEWTHHSFAVRDLALIEADPAH
jgi:DinB superfamily/Pentapeptide repeats (8 copies)